MRLQFFGAAGEVTGSCTLVDTGKTRILVDCGMFQGRADAYPRNSAPFPFDPTSIDAVIVTHAHIDHIGRIPKLVREGFAGRIFATHPTTKLAPIMWEDAATVMKMQEHEYHQTPIYTEKDLGPATDLLQGAEYDTAIRVSSDISFKFREVGHIFGSAFVEMNAAGVRLVFSGDVGNENVPILRGTKDIVDGDIVILESTYGDRHHDDTKNRSSDLVDMIQKTYDKKGILLIPAFSLERTQEILYELHELSEHGKVPKLPIILDSPLAERALAVYRAYPQYYDQEARVFRQKGDDFFQFPNLRIIKDAKESAEIIGIKPPKVIIAGSGMMHGGRVMSHLKQYLDNPLATVLIVGYQGVGTLGRQISEGATKVKIDHEEVIVRAEVKALGSYSAHADQEKLLRWVVSGNHVPQVVYLNHGDPQSSTALGKLISQQYSIETRIPKFGDAFTHVA